LYSLIVEDRRAVKMTDILVKRIPKYVNQFQPTVYDEDPSVDRCGTASAAMCLDFAYPNKYDPFKIEHDLYVKLAGADVPSNHKGVYYTDLLKFFDEMHVGYIDMSSLVEEGLKSDIAPLYDEIEAQNRQGVIQLLLVEDESYLREAITNEKLHNWVDNGLAHYIVRDGFSDDQGYGFYLEPAAPGFKQPVKILWSKGIVPAKIAAAVAIMPPGVPVPPAGFSFQHGVWPEPPKPPVDTDKAMQAILALLAACQNQEKALQQQLDTNKAMQTAITSLQGIIRIEDQPTMALPVIKPESEASA
jgi:hypothetical protein